MQKSAGTLTGKLDGTNSALMQALTDTRKNLADYQNALKDFQATVKDSGSLIDDTLKTLDSVNACLLYTSDAADDSLRVDLGGRRIIKKNFFQAEDGIRDRSVSRGLGDVYKRQYEYRFHPPVLHGSLLGGVRVLCLPVAPCVPGQRGHADALAWLPFSCGDGFRDGSFAPCVCSQAHLEKGRQRLQTIDRPRVFLGRLPWLA